MPDAVFYLLVFAAITCFAMVQSYGDPPDEVNRFMGPTRRCCWTASGLPTRSSPC